MPETYNEDMLAHLYKIQRKVTNGINTVLEIARNGHKYLATERSMLLEEAKAACGDPSCDIAQNYQGNPRPEVPTT